MNKTFDCVEMKHKGAEKVQAMLAKMTIDEQVAYWERRGKELRKQKTSAISHRKASENSFTISQQPSCRFRLVSNP